MRFALLPAKPIALAKSRLAPDLNDADRRAVSLAMFQDVLESLLRASSVEAVAVVTADRRLLDLALRMRAIAIDEEEPRGLNGAVAIGTNRCVELRATSVLVVLSDLPLVTPAEIDALHEDLPSGDRIRLVRSHEGLGTNALLRKPPRAIPTRFGGRSFQGHVAAAIEARVPYDELTLPAIGFDVDTVADLERVVRATRTTRTRVAAEKIGIDGLRVDRA
jgi:2-phospho-L-lactate/phosphoenolpyruvate guanylyltransferase